MTKVDLRLGDCLEVMRSLPDGCVDAVVTDPPYPEIDRDYGRMTEAEWHAMMRGVVAECRRILKPSGSVVFILQPNYETPGRMRPWLWEFLAWTAREWNQVQDAYWLNTSALPTAGCQRRYGLMRSSIKICVWLGDVHCFRDQDSVLWEESEASRLGRLSGRYRDVREACPSGKSNNRKSLGAAVEERGGTTPYNVIPVSTRDAEKGMRIHSAPTPLGIVDYWTRYLVPPGGTLGDPFMGGGTAAIVAIRRGLDFIGIEKMPKSFALAERRAAAERAKTPLLA